MPASYPAKLRPIHPSEALSLHRTQIREEGWLESNFLPHTRQLNLHMHDRDAIWSGHGQLFHFQVFNERTSSLSFLKP